MNSSSSVTALIAAAGLGFACSGCSFMFTRGPSNDPQVAQIDKPIDCSTSAAPPILDLVFTGTHLAGGIAALVWSKESYGRSSEQIDIAAGADLGIAAALAISAIYGFHTIDACKRAKAEHAYLHPSGGDAAPVTPKAKVVEPSGTRGFSFGMSALAAEEMCTKAGNAWQPDGAAFTCVPAGGGDSTPVPVRLEFGASGLRAIGVTVQAGSSWRRSVDRLEFGLRSQYGAPAERELDVPETCNSSKEIAGCVERGEARVSATWRWPSGRLIKMMITGANPAPLIRLTFEQAEGPPAPQ